MDVITVNMAQQTRKDNIEKTVRQERGRLLNFIRQRVSGKEEAEDIMQDVFYQLVEGFDMIESLDKVTSWLFTVARNKITDRYRKKKEEPLVERAINGREEEPLMLADILPDLGRGPEDEYFRTVVQEQLELALDELPEDQREVFVLHELEDKSFKEIAEITGDNVNTLLSRKRYAILYLREKLKELYEEL